ncbi:hypothetical protein CYMTET_18344 [Cymbomonas tetramitiformis]|uniref:adenine phosphoribosyltransferase n=1 Tax=Cymbomonas tetramitiformis TaxID=36881 RepID=A0AAE0G9M4_9CHLO|nr:hypothetical protein CYMTET_18344 [Cymbomonas tetramitiformis]
MGSSLSVPTKELGPKHYCADQTDLEVKQIAQHLPWYGPEYSPHDVPNFYDIAGITENPKVFRKVIDIFVNRYKALGDKGPTRIAGFDARGFIFGPPIAAGLQIPFIMIRKVGKLPGVVATSGEYQTEYSTDESSIRIGSVSREDRVVLIDDLIATGGTALAGIRLVEAFGAEITEFAAIVSLPFMDGVKKIHEFDNGKFKDVSCFTLVDSDLIGPEMCANPPAGTPRVLAPEEVEKFLGKLRNFKRKESTSKPTPPASTGEAAAAPAAAATEEVKA